MKAFQSHKHCGQEHDAQLDSRRVLEKLRNSGVKLTRPRLALLRSLNNFSRPFTTDEAFQAVRRRLRGSPCDLVTVYRSLALFMQFEIVSKVDFGDGVVRYEIASPSGHHHHFLCESCGMVRPLDLCKNEKIGLQEAALEKAGFSRLSHRLEFFGLCPVCTTQKMD